MSARAYGIPLMQALTLVTTQTACGDLMLGRWEGTRVFQYGYTFDLPIVSSYDGGYSYTSQVYLELTRESVGSLELVATSTSYGDVYTREQAFPLTADRISNGVWDVQIPEFYGLTMTCIADRELMTCDGSNEDGEFDIDFKRAE